MGRTSNGSLNYFSCFREGYNFRKADETLLCLCYATQEMEVVFTNLQTGQVLAYIPSMAVPSVCSLSYIYDHQHCPYPQARTALLLYKSFTSLPIGGDFSSSLHCSGFYMHFLELLFQYAFTCDQLSIYIPDVCFDHSFFFFFFFPPGRVSQVLLHRESFQSTLLELIVSIGAKIMVHLCPPRHQI